MAWIPVSASTYPWKDRTAFVSGGASGIGFGLAQSLAARGVRIALSDVHREALEQACESLRDEGADVMPVVLDVSDRAAMYAAAQVVIAGQRHRRLGIVSRPREDRPQFQHRAAAARPTRPGP